MEEKVLKLSKNNNQNTFIKHCKRKNLIKKNTKKDNKSINT